LNLYQPQRTQRKIKNQNAIRLRPIGLRRDAARMQIAADPDEVAKALHGAGEKINGPRFSSVFSFFTAP
jgi:hypothetical protein